MESLFYTPSLHQVDALTVFSSFSLKNGVFALCDYRAMLERTVVQKILLI